MKCRAFGLLSLHRRHGPGDCRGGDGEEHADEGAFDVEPVVVVGGGHVFGAGDDEMLVVAEPDAVEDEGVKPVDDAPEGVSRQRAAPEGAAAVDVAHEQPEQQAEGHEGGELLGVEARPAGPVAGIDEPELLAALDDGRRIVEDALDRVPRH